MKKIFESFKEKINEELNEQDLIAGDTLVDDNGREWEVRSVERKKIVLRDKDKDKEKTISWKEFEKNFDIVPESEENEVNENEINKKHKFAVLVSSALMDEWEGTPYKKGNDSGNIIKTFDNIKDATKFAEVSNKELSSNEKNYYKTSFKVINFDPSGIK